MPKIIHDEQIFRAVMETVIAHGYAGATTKKMAEAANVSEMTLFRKFESKQKLVKQAMASIIKQVDFAGAARYTGDIEADLLRLLRSYMNAMAYHGNFYATFLFEITRNPQLMDVFEQPSAPFQLLGELLYRYQQEDVLKPENPVLASGTLLGPMIYTAMVRSAVPQADLPELDLEVHVRYFLSGRVIN